MFSVYQWMTNDMTSPAHSIHSKEYASFNGKFILAIMSKVHLVEWYISKFKNSFLLENVTQKFKWVGHNSRIFNFYKSPTVLEGGCSRNWENYLNISSFRTYPSKIQRKYLKNQMNHAALRYISHLLVFILWYLEVCVMVTWWLRYSSLFRISIFPPTIPKRNFEILRKLKRSVSVPKCQFSPVGQSLTQPFLAPLAHNFKKNRAVC